MDELIQKRIEHGQASIDEKLAEIAAKLEAEAAEVAARWQEALEDARSLLPDDVAPYLQVPEYPEGKGPGYHHYFLLAIEGLAPIYVQYDYATRDETGRLHVDCLKEKPFQIGQYDVAYYMDNSTPSFGVTWYSNYCADLDEALVMAKREYDENYQRVLDKVEQIQAREKRIKEREEESINDKIANAATTLYLLLRKRDIPF